MDKTPRRESIAPEIAVAGLLTAAALPLGRVFEGLAVWAVAAAAIAASLTVSLILERVRAPLPLSAAGSAVAFLCFAGGLFYRETLIAILPTVETVRGIGAGLSGAVDTSRTEVAPVAAAPELLLAAALGVWATTWLVHDAAVRLRFPLLGIGLALPLFAFPGAVAAEGRMWWMEGTLFLGAALWLLYADHRSQVAGWGVKAGPARGGWMPGSAARLGAVAVALSILAAPLLPGYGDPPRFRGLGGVRVEGVIYDPLVSVQPTLQTTPVRELIRVRSPVPTYLRITPLDTFDGAVWSASEEPATLRVDRGIRPLVPREHAVAINQELLVVDLTGHWVPAAYEPIRIDYPDVRLQPASRGALSAVALERGARYQAASLIPDPPVDLLDRPFTPSRELAPFLELPDDLPAEVHRIAEGIAGAQPTPFRQALAIQEHLRAFTYDENVAIRHSSVDLISFLTEIRRGYCEQFAAAMAVLARALGIPARVVIGFAVGDRVGPDVYSVTTRHAHAWVEVSFPGVGWIPFEPTPRSGVAQVPPYATASELEDPLQGETPGADPAEPDPGPEETPGAEEGRDREGAPPAPGTDPRRALPIGAALLLLAGALPAAARLRPFFVLRRVRGARAQVAARYRLLLDWCAGAGIGRFPWETPREHAARLASDAPAAAPALRRLADVASAVLWGPEPETDPAETDPAETRRLAASARAHLRRAVPRARRIAMAAGWGAWRRDPRGVPAPQARALRVETVSGRGDAEA